MELTDKQFAAIQAALRNLLEPRIVGTATLGEDSPVLLLRFGPRQKSTDRGTLLRDLVADLAEATAQALESDP